VGDNADNAIVLNQNGIDVAAMEREHARQFQAIIIAGNRVYP
jgi:hypothetical protein